MSEKKIKAGFLPLYIELYDKINPQSRQPMEQYFEEAAEQLRKKGMELIIADVCRVALEFDEAIERFKQQNIEVLITMHLAYSPSLECIDALKKLGVPIVVLDSTPCYDFSGLMYQSDEIMPNHGIHGVQDMCNLLKRNNIPYHVEAGHIHHSDIIDRVVSACRAAKAATAFRNARVGIVGESFKGMGDFYKTPEELKSQIGATVVKFDKLKYPYYDFKVTKEEVELELTRDKNIFDLQIEDEQSYIKSTRVGLALQKWVSEEKLTALTINFLDTGSKGIPKMPFAWISKVMMDDIGYAGEGDTLTAGLAGALQSVYTDTSFTEMFCPCWKTGEIFLSHMGEMNLRLAARKPIIFDTPFDFSDAGDAVKATACFRAGKAVFVNIAPTEDGYTIILAPVQMIDHNDDESVYNRTIRGWMKPELQIDKFLSAYSNAGGTHHSVLVYDANIEELKLLAQFMGFSTVVIE